MKPDSAKKRFLDYVEQSGVKLSSLSPTQGINLMLDFYSDERAEGCQIEEDGDMLLFQWGVYDWGEGEHFEVNITRQFIEIGREDDEDEDSMSQLGLTFRFDPDSALGELPPGNRWCRSPEDLTDFRDFIEGCRCWKEAQQQVPCTITLDLGEV